MKQINKTLRLAGILALCINALNVGNLILDIYFGEHVAYYVTIDAVSIALTFATGIVYLCLHKKSEEYLANHKAIFVTLLWLNILNNLFVWIISLWVEIMVSGLQRKFLFTEMHSEENLDDVVLGENSYKVKKEAEDLSTGLKDLEDLKNKGTITEEEYNELRQALINKFLNK